MQAIRVHRFGGPEELRLDEVPVPVPGPGELLIRVHAVGVNPVEGYQRSGAYARLPPLPFTPGTDAAGEVQAVGEGVSRFHPGDRVYTDHRARGAYAELLVCPEEHAHPLPVRVSFAQGAALGVPYATAHRGLFARGGARAGETLLVHGATGGVGLAAVQLARAAGLTVIGTGGSEEGREEARRQGAHHVLDHREPDHLKAIGELTANGVELVLEMLAHVNLGSDLEILAPGGRVVVIGSRGTVQIDPRNLMSRDADIRGVLLFNTPAPEVAAIHAALHAGLENGTLSPVIAAEIPFSAAPRAHELLAESGRPGKIVLVRPPAPPPPPTPWAPPPPPTTGEGGARFE
jgi:NADPH2:quinone reductase